MSLVAEPVSPRCRTWASLWLASRNPAALTVLAHETSRFEQCLGQVLRFTDLYRKTLPRRLPTTVRTHGPDAQVYEGVPLVFVEVKPQLGVGPKTTTRTLEDGQLTSGRLRGWSWGLLLIRMVRVAPQGCVSVRSDQVI